MMRAATFAILLATAVTQAQPASRMDALAAAVRQVLPYPSATPDGELPADNSASSKWFVVWPQGNATRITVKANPLHPDTQRASEEAMAQINTAVAAAERRAQEAYEQAMEQLRRTGKGSDLEIVTLDDEGIAGERIDAELEVLIELQSVDSYAIASGEPPEVAAGSSGVTWVVTVPANTYRSLNGPDRREHFRAAETHLYFGSVAKPDIRREGDEPRYRVTVAPSPGAFVVVLRGNEALVKQLASDADWARLAEHH